MDNLHELSLQLLELLRQYEEGIKNNVDLSETGELRKKILKLQTDLEKEKELVKTH